MRLGRLAAAVLASAQLALCAASPSSAAEVEVGGAVELFGCAYLQEKSGAEDLYGEARFRPTISYAPSEPLLIYLEGDLRADSQGFAQGALDGPTERSGERVVVNLREAYVDYKRNRLALRVGKQIFDWSVTDTVSPSDNLSPRDWTDLLESERIGAPAAYLRVGYGAYAELAYVPWLTPSKLPLVGGRWERELPLGLANEEQEILGRNHGQAALRIGCSLKGFDLSAVYYRGYSFSPSYKLAPEPGGFLGLIPVARFEEVVSASAVKALGRFAFRAEAGYFRQRDEDDFAQVVLGVDREWSGILKPVDSFYLLAQYADEIVAQRDSPVGFETIDFRRALSKAMMVKATYSFDAERMWSLKLEGSYNLADKDSFFEPALVWRKKSVELEAGVDLLSGGERSFFGGYGGNDRLYSKIVYKF